MPYPTKEQILKTEIMYPSNVLSIIGLWKRVCYKGWRDKSNEEKNNDIKALINTISIIYEHEEIKVVIEPKQEPRCEQNSQSNTIFLDANKSSILTSFHELAHALFGGSELKACRWSIWLFKKAFPRSYDKLKWKRHMLIK
jgi:hypothetical protein